MTSPSLLILLLHVVGIEIVSGVLSTEEVWMAEPDSAWALFQKHFAIKNCTHVHIPNRSLFSPGALESLTKATLYHEAAQKMIMSSVS